MNDNQRWGLFLLFTACLIVAGCGLAAWLQQIGWFAAVRVWCGTPVYAGAHRATGRGEQYGRRLNTDLPRSGPTVNAAEGATPVNAARPGEPGWDEDDAATLEWARSLHDDEDEPTEAFELDYDAPTPADAIRTERIGGAYVPNLGYDPAELNLPRPGERNERPRLGEPGIAPRSRPGQPYHPHTGPPAWRQPKPFEPWTWNGAQWIRQAPAGALWIDVLCTMPLRQLEAAPA